MYSVFDNFWDRAFLFYFYVGVDQLWSEKMGEPSEFKRPGKLN